MESHFSPEFFKGNRASLRKLFTGTAPIVLTANGHLQRSGDSPFKFRQDSSFWYLTGVNEPDAILVMDKDKEYLIVPRREGVYELFDGVTDYDRVARVSGIDTVIDPKEGWERLGRRLKKAKHLATLAAAPGYIEHFTMYTNPARAALIEKTKAINPDLVLLDLREHLTKLRCIKQPAEMQALRRAIAITCASFKEISRQKRSLRTEYEIEAKLTHGFRKRATAGHSFDPVVAAGVNAASLHYIHNVDVWQDKDLLLIDAGAEVENYAADITRMFARGELTKRQQAIFDAVSGVHERAVSLLKPGVILRDYEQVIEEYMGEKLRELGLIKVIDHESVRAFFPSLTSHFLGLDVHDVGAYDKPLEPGMVLVVEPGIYVAKENIGVRIEDDFVVTAKGVENLSRKLPQLL